MGPWSGSREISVAEGELTVPAGAGRNNLITLYARALESQRPDALLRDERAEELVRRISGDSPRPAVEEPDLVELALRGRAFDRVCRDFMKAHPGAGVVHIGCGLDTRFWRVDDGHVFWYDLDLPAVIEARRELVGGEHSRYRMLASSVLDESWMDTLAVQHCCQVLLVAEGVLMYLPQPRVRWLLQTVIQRFCGAEIVFDALTPTYRLLNNLKLWMRGSTALARWSVRGPEEVEGWDKSIRLLESCYYLQPEETGHTSPRRMRAPPRLARGAGVFHYRLGETSVGD